MRIALLTALIITIASVCFYTGRANAAFVYARQQDRAKPEKAEKKAKQEPLAEGGAVSTSRLALPFKRSWQYLTRSALTLPATLDGPRIYLPLAGGRIVCLDRETGSLIWSTELGGIITAPVATGEEFIYVATRKVNEDGTEAGASLRAMDKATGLTVWARDYARPFTSALALGRDLIYAGSADGAFYALSTSGGEIAWKVETQDVVRGHALITEKAIYFGSDDGLLRGVAPESGQVMWKFQTEGKLIGRPVIDDKAIYFGSGDGFVYSVELATGKLRWRSRTGAAVVASPALMGDRVIVGSFDNFVYALSRRNGDRLWKRRFDNRIAAPPMVEGDAVMIAPLRGDHVAVFLSADGRRVNFYRLDRESEIVAEPVFSDDTLVIATDKGIVVAVTAQQVDDDKSAIRK
ncbi:MAG: PQQ-binding-like beta-propeller repeat protein [Blastocatellia bacterium]|nr:PQQ-binding-like beta-propeller repeat protein [Blastocatellia bacterium]